jgi:murein L,D-transpeptidase YafK
VKRFIFVLILGASFVVPVFLMSPVCVSAPQQNPDSISKIWENKNVETIDAVRATIHSWVEAWQNMDINSYMYFYSKKFKTADIDYRIWRERKFKRFQKSGSISVEITDLWVFIEGGQATATFIQKYKDSSHMDVGKKNLKLKESNGIWKIIYEKWKPVAR